MTSQTSDFYDSRGDEVLQRGGNPFLTRHERGVALASFRHLESQIPPVAPGVEATYLDLCCGTGSFSILPAIKGYRVLGVDLSQRSVEASQWLARQNGVEDKCRFVVAEALSFLRESTETFDVIQILGSLYYLDCESLLPLLHARLKPGGHLFVIETNGGNEPMNLFRRLRNSFRPTRDQHTLERLMTPGQFTAFERFFRTVELSIFDALVPCLTLLSPKALLRIEALPWLARVDRFLLNGLGLQGLAFKIFYHGRKET